MTQPLVIFGTGGLAREIHGLVEALSAAEPSAAPEFLGWLDDDETGHGSQLHGHPILGGVAWLRAHPDVEVTVAIGAPQARRRVVDDIRAAAHSRFATLIHPAAVIGERVRLGTGVTICAGVVTTTDFSVGDHVLVNISATIAHDDAIGDFATLAPAAIVSGNVSIGEGCDIGTNATIIQGVEVGPWSVVGAGAVVTRSLPANVTAVGAPAKVIKERQAGWHLSR